MADVRLQGGAADPAGRQLYLHTQPLDTQRPHVPAQLPTAGSPTRPGQRHGQDMHTDVVEVQVLAPASLLFPRNPSTVTPGNSNLFFTSAILWFPVQGIDWLFPSA